MLTYPHPPSRPQKNGQTSSLPNHLSGDQIVQFLEERQRQEEEDKAKRKEERERKKKEQEVEEERKRKEREAKKK